MRIGSVLAALAVLLGGCGAGPATPTVAQVPTEALATATSGTDATSPAPNATAAPPAADAIILTVVAMAAALTQ